MRAAVWWLAASVAGPVAAAPEAGADTAAHEAGAVAATPEAGADDAAARAAAARRRVARDVAQPELIWQSLAVFREEAAIDPSQHAACAGHFEAVARELGAGHPRGAEALFAAARCHEAGGAVGPALQIDEALAEKHRDAVLGRSALAAVGRERLALLRFADAAAALETYVARYPNERVGYDGLHEAAALRSALGQYALARADLDRIDAMPMSSPGFVAQVFWSRRALLPADHATDKARRAHAEAYLRRFGADGGPVLRLLALATIGESEWRASCPLKQAGPLGLCVEIERDRPTQCEQKATQVAVRRRDRRLADRARSVFAEVVAAAKPLDELAYHRELREAVAMAEVRLADRELEAYLEVHAPKDLAFHVDASLQRSDSPAERARYEAQRRQREDSTRRFAAFYGDKTRLAGALRRTYDAIVERRSAVASVAVAARVGVMTLAVADELLQSHVALPPGRELRAAFCGALVEQVGPIRAEASEALSLCVTRGRLYGEFAEAARFCEDELQRREPLAFPPLRELFAAGQALDLAAPESIGVQVEPYGFEAE